MCTSDARSRTACGEDALDELGDGRSVVGGRPSGDDRACSALCFGAGERVDQTIETAERLVPAVDQDLDVGGGREHDADGHAGGRSQLSQLLLGGWARHGDGEGVVATFERERSDRADDRLRERASGLRCR